jgi:hypothetical protein
MDGVQYLQIWTSCELLAKEYLKEEFERVSMLIRIQKAMIALRENQHVDTRVFGNKERKSNQEGMRAREVAELRRSPGWSCVANGSKGASLVGLLRKEIRVHVSLIIPFI